MNNGVRTPATPLPRSTPEREGVASAGILAFLDEVDSSRLGLHSLMVVRHGKVVSEGWWAPYSAADVHLLYSLSKSFTSSAIGLAIAEGKLALGDRVTSFFPESVPDDISDEASALTVHDLLSMSTGHIADTLERAVKHPSGDLIRGFLSIPPDRPIGSVFAYNNSTTYILSAIAQQVTGETVLDYLRPRLLDPLGIDEAYWISDRDGRCLGFTGLHATTESIAKLGLLYLGNGVFDGQQVLPAEWVEHATRRQIANPEQDTIDWQQGYGYQFWMSRHGYRGDGAYGQFSLIIPELDLVIAITSGTIDMQGILDAVWQHLIPAMQADALADDPETLASLTKRLATLQLPTVVNDHEPGAATSWTRSSGEPGVAPTPSIEQVTLKTDGDGWILGFAENGVDFALPCQPGTWTESVVALPGGTELKLAISAGWTGPDEFTAEIISVQTPHSALIRCSGREKLEFEVSWVTTPLHSDRLGGLAVPGWTAARS